MAGAGEVAPHTLIAGSENEAVYTLCKDDVGHYVGILYKQRGQQQPHFVEAALGPVLASAPRLLNFDIAHCSGWAGSSSCTSSSSSSSSSSGGAGVAYAQTQYIGGHEGASEYWWMRITAQGRRQQLSEPTPLPLALAATPAASAAAAARAVGAVGAVGADSEDGGLLGGSGDDGDDSSAVVGVLGSDPRIYVLSEGAPHCCSTDPPILSRFKCIYLLSAVILITQCGNCISPRVLTIYQDNAKYSIMFLHFVRAVVVPMPSHSMPYPQSTPLCCVISCAAWRPCDGRRSAPEDVGCTLKVKCRPVRSDGAQGEIFTSKPFGPITAQQAVRPKASAGGDGGNVGNAGETCGELVISEEALDAL